MNKQMSAILASRDLKNSSRLILFTTGNSMHFYIVVSFASRSLKEDLKFYSN